MTDAELIEALGDTGAVAKQLGLSQQQVSNWKRRGISWRYRPTIAALARRRKLAVPSDFVVPA